MTPRAAALALAAAVAVAVILRRRTKPTPPDDGSEIRPAGYWGGV